MIFLAFKVYYTDIYRLIICYTHIVSDNTEINYDPKNDNTDVIVFLER